MRGVKWQLLGIAVILFGIALSLNNFWGICCGGAGLLLSAAGCICREK